MREIPQLCKIYCHENHRKWTELIPHIEKCINTTVATCTGYTAIELMMKGERPNLFQNLTPDLLFDAPADEGVNEKIANEYEKMKQRANNRKKKGKSGSTSWSPKIRQKVLLKTQPLSGVAAGVTAKFMHTLQGPYVIPKIIESSTYEVTDVQGKVNVPNAVINELELPAFCDSKKQVAVQFLRELEEYFKLKQIPELAR
ncbi:hypothetical protein Cfor_00747 [Coptotermes formosanus]|uniref:Uncharacterized protein n=1 Tax=Coptotermes formosanus TaxID=36987 RepID=A0A6L2PLJ3_COPFO|nr:hypothetical protein Cfor_00747 [Coptotermes formosanus]